VKSSDIEDCINQWKLTLKHFKIDRPLNERDELQIARAIQNYGKEWVILALIGATKQKANKNFDPAHFVSLKNYLSSDKIERLVNLGAGQQTPEGVNWGEVFK